MSKTTHYELNTPIGSEVLSVMTGLNPNFNTIDGTMYDNEVRSTQALNKANVNEQNIATALGRITTAEGDIDTLESGLETANTNISGLTSRMNTAESGLVSANNRIQENTNQITILDSDLDNRIPTESLITGVSASSVKRLIGQFSVRTDGTSIFHIALSAITNGKVTNNEHVLMFNVMGNDANILPIGIRKAYGSTDMIIETDTAYPPGSNYSIAFEMLYY